MLSLLLSVYSLPEDGLILASSNGDHPFSAIVHFLAVIAPVFSLASLSLCESRLINTGQ